MKNATASSHPPSRSGFSLMEMLVVMAVVTILLSLAGNGMRTTWRSQQIYASATSLMQAFSLARSNAIRYNMPVQVRIYRFQDGDLSSADPQYRAYQIVSVKPGQDPDKDQFGGLAELTRFEGTTIMSKFPQFSSLVTGDTALPNSDDYGYVAVEFRPDGSTNLETDPAQPWTITLVSDWGADNASKLAKDARTLVISPDTGVVSLY